MRLCSQLSNVLLCHSLEFLHIHMMPARYKPDQCSVSHPPVAGFLALQMSPARVCDAVVSSEKSKGSTFLFEYQTVGTLGRECPLKKAFGKVI
jgi:hypothetical protein